MASGASSRPARITFAAVLGAFLVTCAAPRLAQACNPPPTSITVALPEKGATALPRNHGALVVATGKASLAVSFTGPKPTPANILRKLPPRGVGPSSGVDLHWLRLSEPTMPGQRYTVRAVATGAGGPIDDSASWTAGTTFDASPPSFGGLAEMRIFEQREVGGADCRPGVGFYAELTWQALSETAIIFIHASEGPSADVGEAIAAAVARPGDDAAGRRLEIYIGDEPGREVCFGARAVDVADNGLPLGRLCCGRTGVIETTCPPGGGGVGGTGGGGGTEEEDRPPGAEPPSGRDGSAGPGGGQAGPAGGGAAPGATGFPDRRGCACSIGAPVRSGRGRAAWAALAWAGLWVAARRRR